MILRKKTFWCYTSLLSCSVHFSPAPFSILFNATFLPSLSLSILSLLHLLSLCSWMIGQLVKVPFLQDRLYSKIQQPWFDMSEGKSSDRDQLKKHCSQAHRIILYLSNNIFAASTTKLSVVLLYKSLIVLNHCFLFYIMIIIKIKTIIYLNSESYELCQQFHSFSMLFIVYTV